GDDARVAETAGGDQGLDAGVEVGWRRLCRIELAGRPGRLRRRRRGELDEGAGGALVSEVAEDAHGGVELLHVAAVLERLEERPQAVLAQAHELLLCRHVAAARAGDERWHVAIVNLDENAAIGALSRRAEGQRRQVLLERAERLQILLEV